MLNCIVIRSVSSDHDEGLISFQSQRNKKVKMELDTYICILYDERFSEKGFWEIQICQFNTKPR